MRILKSIYYGLTLVSFIIVMSFVTYSLATWEPTSNSTVDSPVDISESPTVAPIVSVRPTPIPIKPIMTAPPASNTDNVVKVPYFELSEQERWVVECMVMGESGSESYRGQVLVAQCILNACRKDGLQPSVVRVRYKYSGWHESPTESVKKAVSAVFDDGYKETTEPILYFYAPKYSAGRFHETQCYVLTEGGHKFFKEWS